MKTQEILGGAAEALRVAFKQSIRRSMGRVKWTIRDQDAHDAIRAALVGIMGADKVDELADATEVEIQSRGLITLTHRV